MYVPYSLLENIIIAEILLVVFIILITYAMKYYVYRKARHDKKIRDQVESYLANAAATNSPFSEKVFPDSWKRLDIVLPIIYKLDKSIQSPSWQSLREAVARNILLPLARKKFNSRRWMNRLLSAQCFELAMDQEDETRVIELLEDKIPIVHFHAIVAAANFSSPSMINLAINYMSQKRRLGQSFYLNIFKIAKPDTINIIEERLKTETDPWARATCYKILLGYPISKTDINTTNDLNDNNIELRLSAIRYTAYSNQENAIPLLIDLLKDQHWEVRSTSLHLLGDLGATQAIVEISNCLKDPVWWVRVNAATTLKNFGESGITVLNSQDPKEDLYAYETALHVLNIPPVIKQG